MHTFPLSIIHNVRMPPEVSEAELQLAKKSCHIGQAVKISLSEGNWVGGLKISAGARLVSGICFDPELGRHFSERLSRNRQCVYCLG